MALTQSVPDDEIAAEIAAGLPPDEQFPPPGIGSGVGSGLGSEGSATSPGLRPLSRRRATDPRDLIEATEQVRPISLAGDHVLPVLPYLSGLLPRGLPRGITVSVGSGQSRGTGATTLALALASAPSAGGSWVAAVGLPHVGLAALAEAGVALERFAQIGSPPPDRWATVVAALVGAFDIVLIAPPPPGSSGEIRRLAARIRERGSVLVQLDPALTIGVVRRSIQTARRLEVDLQFTISADRWVGLGQGHGHLQARRVVIEVHGRRGAARIRKADLWLSDTRAEMTFVESTAPAETAEPVAPVALAVVEPTVVEPTVVEPTVVEPTGAHAFAGSDVEQLEAARHERIRRMARADLPTPPPTAGGGAIAGSTPEHWSDAG